MEILVGVIGVCAGVYLQSVIDVAGRVKTLINRLRDKG